MLYETAHEKQPRGVHTSPPPPPLKTDSDYEYSHHETDEEDHDEDLRVVARGVKHGRILGPRLSRGHDKEKLHRMPHRGEVLVEIHRCGLLEGPYSRLSRSEL